MLQEINGSLQAQLRVAEFLQSTEMWDTNTIEVVASKLVKEALDGQEEVAAWLMQALIKLKNQPVRSQIVKEIWQEAEKSSWRVYKMPRPMHVFTKHMGKNRNNCYFSMFFKIIYE